MSRLVRALVLALSVTLVVVAAVSAQNGPGGGPIAPPVTPPGGPPRPAGPELFGVFGYPSSFSFDDTIAGSGFQAGEQVTVSAEHVTASPETVTADQSGSFSVRLSFVWIFCGTGGSHGPAPVLRAAGNKGSAAQLTLPQPPCPELLATQQGLASPPPLGNPASPGVPPPAAGSPPAASSGTAIVVTAVVPPIDITPGTPQPIPTVPPHLERFDVAGFGFVAGEHVSLRGTLGDRTSSAVPTTADSQGRLSAAIEAYVPGHCSAGPQPQLVAAGDRGTSVTSPLEWRDPIMSACFAPPPGTPVPPGIPVVPAPAPAQMMSSRSQLSVRLHPAIVSRGKQEHADILTAGGASVSLTVRYPGKKSVRLSTHAGAGGHAVLRWHVPRSVRPGAAHARFAVQPGGASVDAVFTVK